MNIILLLVAVIFGLIAYHLLILYIHAKFELFKVHAMIEVVTTILIALVGFLCFYLFDFIFHL